MGSVKKLALAGTAALLSTTAFAADLSLPPGPALVRPAPVVETGGWYLRGDVGVGMQNFNSFDFTQTNASAGAVWPPSWRIDQKDFGDTSFVGFGVGYAWNNWFRFDVTGEYRAKTKFKALGSYTEFCAPGQRCSDLYDGMHGSSVFLANAYLDMGTWWCLTPFIGAGVGMARNQITGLTDQGIGTASPDGVNMFPISTIGYTQTDKATWNMAWALHAGLTYNVSSNLKIEFAYRFLNLGNVATSEVLCGGLGCGSPNGGPRAFYTIKDLTSQDFKVGLRWMLNPEPVAAPMPVYSPPPPLMRRG